MEAGTAVHPVKDTLVDYTRDFIDYKATSLEKSTIYGYMNMCCLSVKECQPV